MKGCGEEVRCRDATIYKGFICLTPKEFGWSYSSLKTDNLQIENESIRKNLSMN